MKKAKRSPALPALLTALALLLCAAAAAGEVGILVVIEDPLGGTFRVREQETVSSQGNVIRKQAPVVEHGPVSRFQEVYDVSGTDGYHIDIIAVSSRLEDIQVTVTDYSMKLAFQPRLIPGSDPAAASFQFNALELKACCGQ
jgi:hypothetical protein